MRRTAASCLISFFLMATTFTVTASEHKVPVDESYIAGFLAGAQLTDREIINRFDKEIKKEKRTDFFERAFKTRVGERNSVPYTFYAGFCLPNDEVSKTVINNILLELKDSASLPISENGKLVFRAIQSKYPCS